MVDNGHQVLKPCADACLSQGHFLREPIVAPTCWDVLNGRGMGVQRHPGNVKYRTLVFVNKVLYAKCHASDKQKISKGIVAAVRELGGRFLELDERTEIYEEIGDKKAIEKTSQALREGQPQIRKQIYKEEELTGEKLLNMEEVSAEWYFDYSVQVLETLNDADENGTLKEASSPSVPTAMAMALDQFPGLAQIATPTSAQQTERKTFSTPKTPLTSNRTQPRDKTSHHAEAAMAAALDQFPSLVQAGSSSATLQTQSITSTPPPLPPPMYQTSLGTSETPQTSKELFSNEQSMRPSLRRHTSMSIGSIFSIETARQLLETVRASDAEAMNWFEHAAKMAEDEDRVSELRFTDLSISKPFKSSGDPNPRLTDHSECTHYSKSSLMDTSIMTFMEDVSIHEV